MGRHTMPCKIAASGKALATGRAVERLWWWISTCPSGAWSNAIGHLSCTWIPPCVVGTLHQWHARIRLRLSISHVLMHVHLAKWRSVGRI